MGGSPGTRTIGSRGTRKQNYLRKVISNLVDVRSSNFDGARFRTGEMTMQELMGIIDLFKKGKALGPDNITTDFLKDLEHEEIRTHMLDLINQWWTTGDTPDDITLARVVSLYKKGNPELQQKL